MADNGYDDLVKEGIDKLNVDSDYTGTSLAKKNQELVAKNFRLGHPLIITLTGLAFASVFSYFYLKPAPKKVVITTLSESLEDEITSGDNLPAGVTPETARGVVKHLEKTSKSIKANSKPNELESYLRQLNRIIVAAGHKSIPESTFATIEEQNEE